MTETGYVHHYAVQIPVGTPAGPDVRLGGNLALPPQPAGIVVFAHGSGSSRFSPRNNHVAAVLNEAGLGTLLFDLLTEEEEESERWTRHLRFDIELLAGRLTDVVGWTGASTGNLDVGLFGSSTGAAAALVAAARLPDRVQAVVSRGGRPDLAGDALPRVRAPTLFIVGGEDDVVLELNREAAARMRAPNKLVIVPGATHLFGEPGTLDQAANHAARWFREHLEAHGPQRGEETQSHRCTDATRPKPPEERMSRRSDSNHPPTGELLRRGAIAGVSAGVLFALAQMLVAEVRGGGSSEPWRLVASIPLGADVLMGPFTLTVGLVAVGLHLVLSALFGTLWGAVFALRGGIHHGQGRHVLAAMVFGALLYAVNVELIARLAFPWFLEVDRPVQLLLHALAFGLPLGVYLFVQVRPPQPHHRVRRATV